MRFQWIWVPVIATAGACSQEVPAPRPSDHSAPAAIASKPGNGSDAVRFTVEPAAFRICDAEKGAVSASVRWHVERGNPGGVSIYVVDRGGGRKLWLKGGASGQSTTGRWVFPGTRFLLVDETSGDHLAEIQVRGDACE